MNRFLPFMIAMTFLATGCATRTPMPVAVYDFGLAPASAPSGQSVFVADARSADWLETTDMLYRLAYRDARTIARYSSSRWAGTPGAMLTVRLRHSAGNGLNARPRQIKCTLSVSLAEFSQVFDSETSSRAVMHLQAALGETSARDATRRARSASKCLPQRPMSGGPPHSRRSPMKRPGRLASGSPKRGSAKPESGVARRP
jgi:uncharacterized lipoprotein YmbA